MRLNIHGLIDNAKCYQMVRQLRWAEGIECPHCHATAVVKNGFDETQDDRQRYLCRMCNRSFDDLTGTVFAGHHQPLSIWMLCLYFMGLNLSNRQIAAELELNETSIQEMTTILRNGIVAQEPTITLEGTVECDEVYVIAGHKGHPESVKKRANGSKTPTQRTPRSWHSSNGQAADFWNDSAWWSSGVTHAGECATGDDPTHH
jgi:transposase-like protein